ncbi:phage tail protein [Burkholderia sp. Ap-962]|uniref:phage tail protein n=1 Tax=Burkholderia sp. Ap-962 TaxID=2608333 RepID=UPI00141E6719|nr:phage tail protein [Burkholderia sp. Ap-962]NIF73613.1 phage tail protein [Burkholderia sp. Ap-962]
MLMSLDQFVFSLTSAPFQQLGRARGWKHASKTRVGRRDARQYVGPGDDTITLDGVVAPETIGSIASIDELAAMADHGDAYVLVDGSGNVYGAYLITALNETQTYHTPEGVARHIAFTLTLTRVDDAELRMTDDNPDPAGGNSGGAGTSTGSTTGTPTSQTGTA